METTKKEKFKAFFKVFKRVMNIAMDVIIYPVVLFSLFLSTNSLLAKGNGEIQTFFDYSIVTVLSGSMRNAGFEINETVILQGFNVKELRPKSDSHEGDIIAFYYFRDVQGTSGAVTITDFENPPEPTSSTKTTSDKTIKDAVEGKKPIYFHRIVEILMAQDGTYFFRTQGDNNSTPDGYLIKQDYIVGQYLPVPAFITDSLTYLTTTQGIFYVVIIPLSILVFLQIIEVVTLVFAILAERKVLAGEIAFDSEESLASNVGKEMRDFDKVYFYDVTPEKDKDRVKEFLWGHLNTPKATDKDKLKYKQVEMSLQMYEKSREEYWRFWLSQEKSNKNQTKLHNLQRIANILNKTQNINLENKTKAQEKPLPPKALPKKAPNIKPLEKTNVLPVKKPLNDKIDKR